MSDQEYKEYVVHLKSVPGMYAQYNGKIRVMAKDDEDAVEEALMKLKRGAFPDRNRDMWRVESVERMD